MIEWGIFLLAVGVILLSTRVSIRTTLGKFLSLIAAILGATLLVTLILRLVPGDPLDHILGDQAREETRIMMAQDLGLMDKNGHPVSYVVQYGKFIEGIFQNDIKSFRTRRPVFTTIAERLPYTLYLSLAAMIVALLLGPPLGIMASAFQGRWPERFFSVFALMGISIPSFWLGPMLLLLFAIHFMLFPISGADDGIRSVILPAFSLGMALAAMIARLSRASMLEVLHEDYIRTAYAKGLGRSKVFLKHALRNALIPVVTLTGLQFGGILAGTVVTERVFNWPGIGLLLFESIQSLDMPLVQGCILTIAVIYALVNLCTDLLYQVIDPRLKVH